MALISIYNLVLGFGPVGLGLVNYDLGLDTYGLVFCLLVYYLFNIWTTVTRAMTYKVFNVGLVLPVLLAARDNCYAKTQGPHGNQLRHLQNVQGAIKKCFGPLFPNILPMPL